LEALGADLSISVGSCDGVCVSWLDPFGRPGLYGAVCRQKLDNINGNFIVWFLKFEQ